MSKTMKAIAKRISAVAMASILAFSSSSFEDAFGAVNGTDIVFTDVGFYEQNGTIYAYADYADNGTSTYNSNFTVRFYIDGTFKSQASATAPKNAANGIGRVTISAGSISGNHKISAVANLNDTVTYNNNATGYREAGGSAPTQAPTQAPTTQQPTTQAPTTQRPTTQAPTTQRPTTQAPTTQRPTTQAPTTVPVNYSVEVAALNFPSGTIYDGDVITFTAYVHNTSGVTIPAGTTFTVNLGIDAATVQQVTLTQEIPANGYVYIPQTWAASIGGHTLKANVEGGNSVQKRINVQKKINRDYSSASGRDLQVTDVGYVNVTKGNTNGAVSVGDQIKFICYGVNAGSENIGSGTKIGVQFQVDGQGWPATSFTWCDNFFGPLNSHATHDFTANGGNAGGSDKNLWTVESGNHSVMAWIDDSGLIGESNENNNQKTVTFSFPINVSYNSTTDNPDSAISGAAPVALSDVSGLAVTRATKRVVSLSWTAAAGATSYNIYRGGTLVGSTSSTSFSESGTFTEGQNYTYVVKATDGSSESNGVSVTAKIVAGSLEVEAYSVPPNFSAANGISMTADGESVGVFKTRAANIHYYPHNNWKSSEYTNVAIFDYEGDDVDVRITVNRTDINSVTVRPQSDGVTASTTRSGNSTIISMTIPDGKQGQYDLEFNGSTNPGDTLFIFAQEIMVAPSNPWRTVSSGQTLTGHIEVPDNSTLYIEGGGTLEGYVHLGNNSSVVGRGIISQATSGAWGGSDRRNPLSIGYEPTGSGTAGGSSYGRNNTLVEGVSILDPRGWTLNIRNSHDAVIRDVNIMSASSNGDGITVQSSYNINVEGCFIRSFDDSLVIKNYDNINSHHIKFSNCVIWTDLAQSMEIGYETNMGGYGGRVEAGLANSDSRIYNILFYDIDVIHNFHKDVMSVHNANYAKVYHIGYKNIRVEQRSGGIWANGDDYGEFGNYNFGNAHNGDVYARDVQFDNVTDCATNSSINANTFIDENTSY